MLLKLTLGSGFHRMDGDKRIDHRVLDIAHRCPQRGPYTPRQRRERPRLSIWKFAAAELLQQLLEEEIRDELNPPTGSARPLSILLIKMQHQLMKCEDVDRAQCTAMIKTQHTFHVSAKVVGGDDNRDRCPRVVEFVLLKVADEPGLEGRMKRTSDDAQHSERGWLFVKREAKVTRCHVLVLHVRFTRYE